MNTEDIKFPDFYPKERFFSSVFRICSPGMQLWTHYDVSCISLYFFFSLVLYHFNNNYIGRPGWEGGEEHSQYTLTVS